jgi:transcriptional regulator with XRE-family HTH domain
MPKNYTRKETLIIQQRFADNIRKLLEETNTSYGDLSRLYGYSVPALSLYFSCKRTMDIDIMVTLANHFGKTVDELIELIDEKPE